MRWRLVLHPAAPGAVNMAVDETLLESAASENAIATVRFYQFDEPTLSLGYGQRLEDNDHERLRSLGVSIVRRMTGGRSLLHQHELTYSVTAPTRELFQKRSVKQSYKRITEAIASALRRLGTPIDEPGPSSHRRAGARRRDCPAWQCPQATRSSRVAANSSPAHSDGDARGSSSMVRFSFESTARSAPESTSSSRGTLSEPSGFSTWWTPGSRSDASFPS